MILQPGQLVVCIRDYDAEPLVQHCREIGITFPRKGVVYTVRAVLEFDFSTSVEPALYLEEIINRPLFLNLEQFQREPPFPVKRFRPVDDGALEAFRRHLVVELELA